MSFGGTAVVVCLTTILLGIAATHPLELRNHRWLRIILSLPVVVLIGSVFFELSPIRGYFAMWFIAVLAFIWAGPLSHHASAGFVRLIHGDGGRNTGIIANFGAAKAFRKHGEIVEAIALTESELEKEPTSYEGLVLLSELLEGAHHYSLAIAPLEKLLIQAALTPQQRERISTRKQSLEDRILVEKLNAR
jgi:hypothetical protein